MSSAAIKNAAMALLLHQKDAVTAITSTEPTSSDFRKFKKEVAQILKIVGNYSYMIQTDEEWQAFTGDPTATRPNPNDPGVSPNFAGLTELGQIENAKATHAASKEAYWTHQGIHDALKQIIFEKVPEQLTRSLNDEDHGFTNASPMDMMDAVKAASADEEAFGLEVMLQQYFEPPDLQSQTPLQLTFDEKERLKRELNAAITPEPVPSHGALQVMLLAHFKKDGGFKKEVEDWEAKPADERTWDDFVAYFSDKDKKRRLLLKNGSSTGTAGSSQFSANNVTEQDIDAKITKGLAAGFVKVTEALEEALATSVKPASSSQFSSSTAATTKKIEELTRELDKLKSEKTKRLSSRRERQRKMDKRCPHCNRWHPFIAEEKCYGHPNFSGQVPAGWTPAAIDEGSD